MFGRFLSRKMSGHRRNTHKLQIERTKWRRRALDGICFTWILSRIVCAIFALSKAGGVCGSISSSRQHRGLNDSTPWPLCRLPKGRPQRVQRSGALKTALRKHRRKKRNNSEDTLPSFPSQDPPNVRFHVNWWEECQ